MSEKVTIEASTQDVVFCTVPPPDVLFPRMQELHKGKKPTAHSIVQAFFQVCAEEDKKAMGRKAPSAVLADDPPKEGDTYDWVSMRLLGERVPVRGQFGRDTIYVFFPFLAETGLLTVFEDLPCRNQPVLRPVLRIPLQELDAYRLAYYRVSHKRGQRTTPRKVWDSVCAEVMRQPPEFPQHMTAFLRQLRNYLYPKAARR